MGETQRLLDQFYWRNGACCAGCDHWEYINSLIGECKAAAPVSGAERLAMIGVGRSSLQSDAGHVLTKRNHKCGAFKDDFDWQSLPLAYRKSIGCYTREQARQE